MKNLEEVDCNESLWNSVTFDLRNGWGGLENECRFAFKTKDDTIVEDDIDSEFWVKYPTADQIEVSKVEVEDSEEGMIYFGVSMIIYNSGI